MFKISIYFYQKYKVSPIFVIYFRSFAKRHSLRLHQIYPFLEMFFLIKSKALSPSKAKVFSIKSIMSQKTQTNVAALSTSKSQFGVLYENQFVLSEDGRHLIGVDASDLTRILVEDLTTGSSFCFGKHT